MAINFGQVVVAGQEVLDGPGLPDRVKALAQVLAALLVWPREVGRSDALSGDV